MKAPSAPIVCGVDGSDSALAAAGWAAQECARLQVPLLLVHAFMLPTRGYPEVVLVGSDIRHAMEEQGRAWLEEARAAARAAAPEVEVTTEVFCCGAGALLIELSKTARQVVVGSRGLGTVTGLFIGSTAVALAAHAQSPVVVVRGTAVPGGPVVVVRGRRAALHRPLPPGAVRLRAGHGPLGVARGGLRGPDDRLLPAVPLRLRW
ncbi:universal stress protein [Lentzea terrae]|uniref:universal stress protein n=1 Tax=Lentzea terrae TaxID=2200761 RepID=UPI001E389C05|nr:universal stress protein [Lentzea terrae]